MSKRMTDTGKWDKKWFRELPAAYKLFWQFILDRCDLAGFWDIDFEAASFFIGSAINKDKAISYFKEQVYEVNGKYWLVLDFIKFQNGWPLNNSSPVHKKIIDILNSKGIDIKDNTLWDRVSDRVCHTPQVIVIVEDNTKGGVGGRLPKKQQPPINLSDLTDELKAENEAVYKIASVLLNNCQDVMSMKHPISLAQLKDLVNKWGSVPVNDIIKNMENKGIDYLRKHNCNYTYLTIDAWLNRDKKRNEK